MRQPPERQTGAVGQSAVTLAFEELGWGVAPTPGLHDYGTDLWVMPRSDDGLDLGFVLGVQVKAGTSAFGDRLRPSEAGAPGWWFHEDRRHFDYWLDHAVLHVVVLYDPDARQAFWSLLDGSTAIPARASFKVAVPAAQALNENAAALLLGGIAGASGRASLEGSSWHARTVPDKDVWRFALIAPRLVAPHPNAGPPTRGLQSAEAVALVVQGRWSTLDRAAAANNAVPRRAAMASHVDWGWRFADALLRWTRTDDIGPVLSLSDKFTTSAQAAAGAIAASAALVLRAQRSSVEEGLRLLESADGKVEDPVDQAWLALQKARLHLELGDADRGLPLALRAYGVGQRGARDKTASAIAGVAAGLIFNARRASKEDFGAAIRGGDTAAVWWRSQITLRGLAAAHARQFKLWTRSTASEGHADGDPALGGMMSSLLVAGFMGSQPSASSAQAMRAEELLMDCGRESDAADVTSALLDLVRAGERRSVERATRRLERDGPARAVRDAAASFVLGDLTATSLLAGIELTRVGGDVLEPAVAAESIAFLRQGLADPEFIARRTPRFAYDVEDRIATTLLGLVEVAPLDVAETAAQHLEVDEGTWPRRADHEWAQVVHALVDCGFEGVEFGLPLSSEVGESELAVAVLRMNARTNEAARARLETLAVKGHARAIWCLKAAGALGASVAEQALGHTALGLADIIRRAEGGDVSSRSGEMAHLHAVLLQIAPVAEQVTHLLDFIAAPKVPEVNKRSALGELVQAPEALMGERDRAVRALDEMEAAALRAGPWFFDNEPELARVACLRARLGAAEVTPTWQSLVRGGLISRTWGAGLLAHERLEAAIPALSVLLADSDVTVRAVAANVLSARHSFGMAAHELIRAAVQESGSAVPVALLEGVDSLVVHDRFHLVPLLEPLKVHPSAAVRRLHTRIEID